MSRTIFLPSRTFLNESSPSLPETSPPSPPTSSSGPGFKTQDVMKKEQCLLEPHRVSPQTAAAGGAEPVGFGRKRVRHRRLRWCREAGESLESTRRVRFWESGDARRTRARSDTKQLAFSLRFSEPTKSIFLLFSPQNPHRALLMYGTVRLVHFRVRHGRWTETRPSSSGTGTGPHGLLGIDGKTPAQKREQLVNDFRSRPQLQAGSARFRRTSDESGDEFFDE